MSTHPESPLLYSDAARNRPTKRCQCADVCGEVFSTVANFDAHWKGGVHHHPSEVGLELKPGGWWGGPGDEDARFSPRGIAQEPRSA